MMRTAKNLTSALLGLAMLAVPMTAAAQSYNCNVNRDAVPIYQESTVNREGVVLVHDDDWREHHRWEHRWHHDRDDWRRHERAEDWRYRRNYNRYTYNHYRTVCDHDGDDCRQVPIYR